MCRKYSSRSLGEDGGLIPISLSGDAYLVFRTESGGEDGTAARACVVAGRPSAQMRSGGGVFVLARPLKLARPTN